jgi:hypothetical protein
MRYGRLSTKVFFLNNPLSPVRHHMKYALILLFLSLLANLFVMDWLSEQHQLRIEIPIATIFSQHNIDILHPPSKSRRRNSWFSKPPQPYLSSTNILAKLSPEDTLKAEQLIQSDATLQKLIHWHYLSQVGWLVYGLLFFGVLIGFNIYIFKLK